MEENEYCPKCGHKFGKREGNYNYNTANVDYVCKNCGWEGSDMETIDEDIVKEELEEELGEGIEVTSEDVFNVINQLEYYDSYEEAVKDIANGIRECLYNNN